MQVFEGRAKTRRQEQDALALLLADREAAVLEREQAAQVASRYAAWVVPARPCDEPSCAERGRDIKELCGSASIAIQSNLLPSQECWREKVSWPACRMLPMPF